MLGRKVKAQTSMLPNRVISFVDLVTSYYECGLYMAIPRCIGMVSDVDGRIQRCS